MYRYLSPVQVVRMRANLLCGRGGVSHLVDEDTRHSLPIGQMGNYQDYLKKQPLPLRELESAPVRQHMFGNPFKTNKNLMMMTDEVSGLGGVDEVQIVNAGGQTPVSGGTVGGLQHLGRGLKRPAEQLLAAPPKRRKGPLPRDFQLRSPRESPAYRPELDYVPDFLNPEVQAAPSLPPLVNGLKTAVFMGGKIASCPIEIDLESEDSAAMEVEELQPAALRGEEPNPVVGKLTTVNHKLAEAGPLQSQPPARNHFNKNNNKTDYLRHDVAGKPGIVEPPSLLNNCEVAVPPPPADVYPLLGGASYPVSPSPPLQTAGWQPNGQLEHHAALALQPRHRLESLNAFSKDVIGEILNLPPAEPPSLPPPAPPAPAAKESSPEVVVVLDHVPAKRNKKVVSAGMRWETPPNTVEVIPVSEVRPVAVSLPASVDVTPAGVDGSDSVTEEELRSFRLRNNNVRQLIYKEVKRPGRCHVHLWKMLEGLHGPPWVRKQFIHEVKQEALR